MILVGTSGYGYHEWSPAFYPMGLCYEDYLSHYAQHFSCCELSHTFFHMPSPRNLSRLVRKVPESFRFTVKLNRRLTHERGADLQLAKSFTRSVRPLMESGQLGAVLAQFPFSFMNNPYSRAYLCRLRAALELPLVAELRNDTWRNPETLAFLRGWGIGLAAIDAPALGGFMPPMAVATSAIGYVRFHGRDATSWWRRGSPLRYEYRYRQRELMSWLPRIREIARGAEETFVSFNNHRRTHAVANAATMSRLLARSSRSKKRVSARQSAQVG
jgi:uncharacterized protein YecE (DUF72 family)